jgi:hypothetical protein
MICHALTKGYLVPVLRANGDAEVGPNGGRIVIWYDPSEIVQRPDKSSAADEAYDRMEINGVAYRREKGFSESDAPSGEELEAMTELLERRSRATGAAASTSTDEDNPDPTETAETDAGSGNPADTQATEPGGA